MECRTGYQCGTRHHIAQKNKLSCVAYSTFGAAYIFTRDAKIKRNKVQIYQSHRHVCLAIDERYSTNVCRYVQRAMTLALASSSRASPPPHGTITNSNRRRKRTPQSWWHPPRRVSATPNRGLTPRPHEPPGPRRPPTSPPSTCMWDTIEARSEAQAKVAAGTKAAVWTATWSIPARSSGIAPGVVRAW